MYPFIKQYYKDGLYNIQDLKMFVQAEYITKEQFKIICGVDYTE